LDDPEKAKQMGIEGYRRLKESFSIEALVDKHLRMYNAVLSA
jgi:hypothetical protein